MPDGAVPERARSAGGVFRDVREHRVCWRTADAPETYPKFFPAAYSSPSRSGLSPFLICILSQRTSSYIQEHDTDAATWWVIEILSIVSKIAAPRLVLKLRVFRVQWLSFFIAGVVLLSLQSAGLAQTTTSITLDQAIDLALAHNHALKATRT